MSDNLHIECPSYEDISAFFDGELDPSTSAYAHIEKCEKCREQLEAYKKVSDSFKEELKNSVPRRIVACDPARFGDDETVIGWLLSGRRYPGAPVTRSG